MKLVYIIGTGTNGTTSLTAEAKQAIGESEALIGAERMLKPFWNSGKPCFFEIKAEDILEAIKKCDRFPIAVAMSGDVGFFSGAAALVPLLEGYDTKLIPGVSSMSAFFAKIRRPWQDVKFVSLHGRNADIVSAVRRNSDTFCLTDGGVGEIARRLKEYGFGDLEVWVGEKLGYEDERICSSTVNELIDFKMDSLCVLLIHNDSPEKGIRFGIDDCEFIRGDVPMTKAEVRAVTLSKLKLSPTDICYDIGAGTGSVSVEMALSCFEGKVYAIEREPDGVFLIRKNAVKHKTANIEILLGEAPDELHGLPAPDAVFIGGAGGNLGEIIKVILEKNKNARLVINAVTLETLHLAVSSLESLGFEPEITQISVSKVRKRGNYNLMTAQNPVFIISGGGKGQELCERKGHKNENKT